jgi:hypothetical protein
MFSSRLAGFGALAGLLSTLPVASAWWAAGHMTVAAVAATQLNPKAQQAVQNMLNYDAASYVRVAQRLRVSHPRWLTFAGVHTLLPAL